MNLSNKADISIVTCIKETYQRNNKRGGLKNLRCFPDCALNEETGLAEHRRGFCGQVVELKLSYHSASVQGVVWAVCIFEESLRPLYKVGSTVPLKDAQESVKTRSDPLRPWYRGECVSFVTQGGWTRAMMHCNRAARCWHYGWISNKHRAETEHVVRAYLFEERPNGMLECLASTTSTAFQLCCRRRAPKDKTALPPTALERKSGAVNGEGAPSKKRRRRTKPELASQMPLQLVVEASAQTPPPEVTPVGLHEVPAAANGNAVRVPNEGLRKRALSPSDKGISFDALGEDLDGLFDPRLVGDTFVDAPLQEPSAVSSASTSGGRQALVRLAAPAQPSRGAARSDDGAELLPVVLEQDQRSEPHALSEDVNKLIDVLQQRGETDVTTYALSGEQSAADDVNDTESDGSSPPCSRTPTPLGSGSQYATSAAVSDSDQTPEFGGERGALARERGAGSRDPADVLFGSDFALDAILDAEGEGGAFVFGCAGELALEDTLAMGEERLAMVDDDTTCRALDSVFAFTSSAAATADAAAAVRSARTADAKPAPEAAPVASAKTLPIGDDDDEEDSVDEFDTDEDSDSADDDGAGVGLTEAQKLGLGALGGNGRAPSEHAAAAREAAKCQPSAPNVSSESTDHKLVHSPHSGVSGSGSLPSLVVGVWRAFLCSHGPLLYFLLRRMPSAPDAGEVDGPFPVLGRTRLRLGCPYVHSPPDDREHKP